jgi:hypothetical protein
VLLRVTINSDDEITFGTCAGAMAAVKPLKLCEKPAFQ